MIISRNWLQTYFTTALPDAETIADTLLSHSFEIEGIEKREEDMCIDIDVLPNRAHDCLCHKGIAREYAAIQKLDIKEDRYHYHDIFSRGDEEIAIGIQSEDQCYRYMARMISGIQVGESPKWLQQRMESLGERSINNIVDATNYVMFDLGNPLHAFDADKVVGTITVRNAQSGEQFTALGGEEYELESEDLVIADDEGILALAGIKGGTKAEVGEHTTSIILESANFNPTTTRTTARRLKLFTHASKRYENGITSEIAADALEAVSRVISDCAHTSDITLHKFSDVYAKKEEQSVITLNHERIETVLGISIEPEKVRNLLESIGIQVHQENTAYTITVPYERLDLRIAEDIVEEVGRLYGYANIPARKLDIDKKPSVHHETYVEHAFINFLVHKGFSEIETYSFVKKGDQTVINPIASDKSALRKNLIKGFESAVELNAKQSDFLNIDTVKIFEIGTIYTKKGEEKMCAIAIEPLTKSARKQQGTDEEQLQTLIQELEQFFGIALNADTHKNIITFKLPSLDEYDSKKFIQLFDERSYSDTDTYHTISMYPYSKRDVSLWAPEGLQDSDIQSIIQKNAGPLLKKIYLFDTFEKDGKTSYAYNLILQSDEDTLTDVQIDTVMKNITSALKEKGAEIR